MRWHIKVLRGCNVCANSFIALRAPRRATRFLPREILTVPPPPFGASPAPRTTASDAAPDDVPPTRQRHGPRDPRRNVPPPATTPRRNVLPPATYHPRDNVPPPATQLPRRSPDNVAGAPEPSSRRPHTPAPSPAHPATQLRTRPPTQPSAVTHDRRSSPPHEAPTQRHPQRRSTTRRHTGARAKHQGATQLPHDTPTQRHGARSKAPSRPKHNRSAWLHHDTTDEQHDTPKPDQSVTKRQRGCLTALPPLTIISNFAILNLY